MICRNRDYSDRPEYWIPAATIQKMLNASEFYSFSSCDGFPDAKVDWEPFTSQEPRTNQGDDDAKT